jgi:hypothetical protein
MTHDGEPQTPAEHGAKVEGRRPAKDPLLAILVKSIDSLGAEISVTLHVNGVIISGMMCSIKSFFEEQAEMIRQLAPAGDGGFAEAFDWLAGQIEAQPSTEHAGEDAEATEIEAAGADLPDFIHLRAASVHAPGTTAVLPETLWRGRLEHVSGWSIGTFGPKPPPRSGTAIP